MRGDKQHRRKVLPMLVHGDAAFAGRVVAEADMSQLGRATHRRHGARGGEHIQIGSRRCPKCAFLDVGDHLAKLSEVPIFPLGTRRPAAVMFVTETALDFARIWARGYRPYCYRKYGHQEVDEHASRSPIFTLKSRSALGKRFIRASARSWTLSQETPRSLETEDELRLK